MGLLTAIPQTFKPIVHTSRTCCDTELCSLHSADQIWRNKELKICWSLNKSKEFHGELPAQSWTTKEIVAAEAKVIAERVRNSDRNLIDC